VVKGEVCKTSMQRFESARRLQFFFQVIINPSRDLNDILLSAELVVLIKAY
jgi:hypothetical protein